jgi:hypothetical protein
MEDNTERLAPEPPKRGRPREFRLHCLAQVKWTTCVQEWYPRDTYDAKRRAHQLRGFGYQCEAKHVGKMPVVTRTGRKLIEVTLLTAWSDQEGAELPAMKSIGGAALEKEAA